MSNAKQTKCDTLASRETLATMIETLSGALFSLDDTETIVYANARAQGITGATPEELCGNPFWRSTPQLVSTALYQAVFKTRQTQEPAEVEYCSPVTGTWLHVQLAPTVRGVMLQFHQVSAPARHQETFPQGERFSIDDLDGERERQPSKLRLWQASRPGYGACPALLRGEAGLRPFGERNHQGIGALEAGAASSSTRIT